MIDIHCHILPGIDDGPVDAETSLAMFRMAADDGITQIVATPHYRFGERPSIDDIGNVCTAMQNLVTKEKIAVTLLQGADIHLTYELFTGLSQQTIPTINRSRYFLLELPDLVPPHLSDFLFEAEVHGLIPIITHPERNYSLLASPEKTTGLREAGALFQLTAMSITGEFGRKIRKFSHTLLKQGFVDFVASDAHSIGKRSPVLSAAYREVYREFGKETSQYLFHDNPLAVIEDREIIA